MYADDTVLLFRAKNADELQNDMQVGLRVAEKWFAHNKLTLNLKKTKFMLLGTRQRLAAFSNLDLILSNQHIEKVKTFKYLGVMLDEQLLWKEHIDYIASKVSQRIGFLRRSAKPVLPNETLKILCCSLIMPLLDYCDVAWSNASSKILDRLLKLHNRMARMILGAHPRTHIADMFRELKWKELPIRWNQHRMIQVYKCLNDLAPDYLKYTFTRPSHAIETRFRMNSSLSNTMKLINNAASRTFEFMGYTGWNNLSVNQRNSRSLHAFKLSLNNPK